MISQYELIENSKRLGCPLTTQTLRNYIKAGLCQGSKNTPNGIEARGVLPIYPITTLPEALTAKTMMQVSGRKLDKIVVILARELGTYILKHGLDILEQDSHKIFSVMIANVSSDIGTFSLNQNIITWTKLNRQDIMAIMTGRNTRVSKGKDYNIQSIIPLAAEWLTLFSNYSDFSFRRLREKYPNIPYLVTIRNVQLTDFNNTYVGQHPHQDIYLFTNKHDALLSREEKLGNLKSYFEDAELHNSKSAPLLFDKVDLNSLFDDLRSLPEFISISYKAII